MTLRYEIDREVRCVVRKAWTHPNDLLGHLLRTWRLRQSQRRLATHSSKAANQKGYLAHFGVHLTGDNAGDVVLYDSVQKALSPLVGLQSFRSLPLRKPVTEEMIRELNQNARGVVVGGGGLFFPMDITKSASGWQWNIDAKLLESIQIPLLIYGVGVNNFRGQESFSYQAIQHIEATCRKAAFIGLRNNGSLRKLRCLIPEVESQKLFWQPCPTTVLGYLTEIPTRRSPQKLNIAVNIAMDRADLRFGDQANSVLAAIAHACHKLQSMGHHIIVVTHAEKDELVIPYLRKLRFPFRVKRLERCLPEEVILFYSQTDLTLGMRGHAQMIPFGCGNAILSIKSHDKLAYFLGDIGHPEWGVEALDPALADQLFELARSMAADLGVVKKQVAMAREMLWDVCQTNLTRIRTILGSDHLPKMRKQASVTQYETPTLRQVNVD